MSNIKRRSLSWRHRLRNSLLRILPAPINKSHEAGELLGQNFISTLSTGERFSVSALSHQNNNLTYGKWAAAQRKYFCHQISFLGNAARFNDIGCGEPRLSSSRVNTHDWLIENEDGQIISSVAGSYFGYASSPGIAASHDAAVTFSSRRIIAA